MKKFRFCFIIGLMIGVSSVFQTTPARADDGSFVSRVQLTACRDLILRLRDPRQKARAQRDVDAAVLFSMIAPENLDRIDVPLGPLLSLKRCGKAIAKATCASQTQALLNSILSQLAKEPEFVSISASKAAMGCAAAGAVVGLMTKRRLGSAVKYGTFAAGACAGAQTLWRLSNCAKRSKRIYALTGNLPWPYRVQSTSDLAIQGNQLLSHSSLSSEERERLNDEFAVRVMLVEEAAKR